MSNLARTMFLGALLSLFAVADLAAQSIDTYVQPSERTITRRDLGSQFIHPFAMVPLTGGARSAWLPITESANSSLTSSLSRASRLAPRAEFAAEEQRAEALLIRLLDLLDPPGNVLNLSLPIQVVDPPNELTDDRPSIDYGRDPWDEVPRNPAP